MCYLFYRVQTKIYCAKRSVVFHSSISLDLQYRHLKFICLILLSGGFSFSCCSQQPVKNSVPADSLAKIGTKPFPVTLASNQKRYLALFMNSVLISNTNYRHKRSILILLSNVYFLLMLFCGGKTSTSCSTSFCSIWTA